MCEVQVSESASTFLNTTMSDVGERDYYSSQQTATPTFLMPRVCFKPITLYIEMHHMRAYFLYGVMTFSYYVMFIHNMFIFKRKAYRSFFFAIELSAWLLFIS